LDKNQTVYNTYLTWTCVIAQQITDPSSRHRGRPTWRRKKVIVTQKSYPHNRPWRPIGCSLRVIRGDEMETQCLGV
jgi:hypothetical protein